MSSQKSYGTSRKKWPKSKYKKKRLREREREREKRNSEAQPSCAFPGIPYGKGEKRDGEKN